MSEDLVEFGLRPLGADAGELVVKALENAVERHHGQPPAKLSMGYRRADILEGEAFFYLPVTWIGCCGMLVLKKPGYDVVVFGSFVGAATHIWAWMRGVNFEGTNDLVIRAVHDERETLRCLKKIWTARYVNNTVKPQLRSSMPVRIPSSELYFGIGALREAEGNRWFDFRIEPPTEDTDPSAGEGVRRSPFR
jgi:hypothetical protein